MRAAADTWDAVVAARSSNHSVFVQVWDAYLGVTEELTYADLAIRVKCAQADLVAHGMEPGECVAVLSPPTIRHLVCTWRWDSNGRPITMPEHDAQ